MRFPFGAVLLLTVACESRSPARSPVDQRTVDSSSHASAIPAARDDSGPASVIRHYYDAINARRYDDAWRLWSQSGAASGKTLREFEAGFANTTQVAVTVDDSVRVEGAAGSQYATIGVVVDATLASGARQRFTGTYTLRRAMVDGATPEQRAWRIYSAELSER